MQAPRRIAQKLSRQTACPDSDDEVVDLLSDDDKDDDETQDDGNDDKDGAASPPVHLLPDRPIDDHCKELIARFTEKCHCKQVIAVHFLRATNWNCALSMQHYMERAKNGFTHTEALVFAETICQEFRDACARVSWFTHMDLVARDVTVTWAARFSNALKSMAKSGRSTEPHVLFHWTRKSSLATIQEFGLLTKAARASNAALASVASHGSVYGDGLYVVVVAASCVGLISSRGGVTIHRSTPRKF
jgi:hypothetical protein